MRIEEGYKALKWREEREFEDIANTIKEGLKEKIESKLANML